MPQETENKTSITKRRSEERQALIADLAEVIQLVQSRDLSVCKRNFLTSYNDLLESDKLVFLKFFPYHIRHWNDQEDEGVYSNDIPLVLKERWKLLVSMAIIQGTVNGQKVKEWIGDAYINGTDSFKNSVQYWLTLDDWEEPVVYYQFLRKILWPSIQKGTSFDLAELLNDLDLWKYTGRRDYANTILDRQYKKSKLKDNAKE